MTGLNARFSRAQQQESDVMRKSVVSFLLTLCLCAIPSTAKTGPVIAVIDSPDFDAGAIRENTVSSVKHVFKVKNTGDSVLVIKEIKPG
jgi:hypothetical protein